MSNSKKIKSKRRARRQRNRKARHINPLTVDIETRGAMALGTRMHQEIERVLTENNPHERDSWVYGLFGDHHIAQCNPFDHSQLLAYAAGAGLDHVVVMHGGDLIHDKLEANYKVILATLLPPAPMIVNVNDPKLDLTKIANVLPERIDSHGAGRYSDQGQPREVPPMKIIVKIIPHGSDRYYVWQDPEGFFGVTKNNADDAPAHCAYKSLSALKEAEGI